MAYDDSQGFLVNSKYRIYINTKEPGETTNKYERLACGISELEQSDNPEVDQTAYMCGDGFGTSTVTGAQLTISFTGHRLYDDAAQNWIFKRRIGIGRERESDMYVVEPDGTVYHAPVTLAGIGGGSGGANEKSEIEIEIHFNGRPTVTYVEPPTGLDSSSITATGATLSWDIVEVPAGATTVTYDVYQDGVKVGSDLSTNTYNATDLTAETQYNFDVVTKVTFDPDIIVESPHSDPVVVTTSAGA